MSKTLSASEIAKQGYDKQANRYLEWVSKRPGPRLIYTEKLLQYLSKPEEAHILELGCGAGVPCTKLLAESCKHVTANDISKTQIDLARQHLSERQNVTFLEGDMTMLEFPEGSLDGVTAFYSIIHLEPHLQVSMWSKIRKWLKPNGLLLLNLAGSEEPDPGKVIEEWLGMQAYWSSFGRSKNLQLVKDQGFELVEHETTDEVEDAPFLWMIARAR